MKTSCSFLYSGFILCRLGSQKHDSVSFAAFAADANKKVTWISFIFKLKYCCFVENVAYICIMVCICNYGSQRGFKPVLVTLMHGKDHLRWHESSSLPDTGVKNPTQDFSVSAGLQTPALKRYIQSSRCHHNSCITSITNPLWCTNSWTSWQLSLV